MTVLADNPPARGEEPSSRALSAAVSAVQPHRRGHGDKFLSYLKSETLGSGESNQEVEEKRVEKKDEGNYGQLQQGKLNVDSMSHWSIWSNFLILMHCYDFDCKGFLSSAQQDFSLIRFAFLQPASTLGDDSATKNAKFKSLERMKLGARKQKRLILIGWSAYNQP